MKRIARRPQAKLDIIDAATFFAGESFDLSDRFLAAVKTTLRTLAEMPGMGSLFPTGDPDLADMRHFRVQGFPNYFVFYLPSARGIEVVRVLHRARDLRSIFGED